MVSSSDLIYSFDVFDTVITRAVARPSDVFKLMGEKLASAPTTFSGQFIKYFYSIRIHCERAARNDSDKEDIRFEEIYSFMGRKYQLNDQQIKYLQDLELTLEDRLSAPIMPIVEEIKRCRRIARKIIFVSDMYLSPEFITGLLKKTEVYEQKDSIYVSGHAGVTKASSNLFKKILECEKCSPREVVHFGDNPYSDFFIPIFLGIKIYCPSWQKMSGLRKIFYHKGKPKQES